MITVTYKKKRKYLELRSNKKKDFSIGKKLSQPGLFPLKLQDDELQWKIQLRYDV